MGPPSDLYSLGVTLYEALCGEPPFLGEDTHAPVTQHRTPRRPRWPSGARRPPARSPKPRAPAAGTGPRVPARERRRGARRLRRPARRGLVRPFAGSRRARARVRRRAGGPRPGRGRQRRARRGEDPLARELADRVAAHRGLGPVRRVGRRARVLALGGRAACPRLPDLPTETHRIIPALGEAAAPAATAAEARFALFEAVDAVLRRVAAERPLVVVIEDVQWADRSRSSCSSTSRRSWSGCRSWWSRRSGRGRGATPCVPSTTSGRAARLRPRGHGALHRRHDRPRAAPGAGRRDPPPHGRQPVLRRGGPADARSGRRAAHHRSKARDRRRRAPARAASGHHRDGARGRVRARAGVPLGDARGDAG